MSVRCPLASPSSPSRLPRRLRSARALRLRLALLHARALLPQHPPFALRVACPPMPSSSSPPLLHPRFAPAPACVLHLLPAHRPLVFVIMRSHGWVRPFRLNFIVLRVHGCSVRTASASTTRSAQGCEEGCIVQTLVCGHCRSTNDHAKLSYLACHRANYAECARPSRTY